MGFRASLSHSVSLRFRICKMKQLDLDKCFFTFIVNQTHMRNRVKNTSSWLPSARYFDLIGSVWGPGIYIYNEVSQEPAPLERN